MPGAPHPRAPRGCDARSAPSLDPLRCDRRSRARTRIPDLRRRQPHGDRSGRRADTAAFEAAWNAAVDDAVDDGFVLDADQWKLKFLPEPGVAGLLAGLLAIAALRRRAP